MNLLYIIIEDFKAMTLTKSKPSIYDLFKHFVINYKLRIVFRVRVSQFLIKKGFISRKIAHLISWQNLRRGIDISPLSTIGAGLRIAHPVGIVIGDRCIIGKYCSVLQNVTIGGSYDKEVIRDDRKYVMPVIGDFVEINAGAVIAGPVFINDYAIVGANSLVIKNVEKYQVVSGIPAKVIKEDTQPHSHGLVGMFNNIE